MKKYILIPMILCLVSAHVNAYWETETLIQENIQQDAEKLAEPARVWVHIQSERQKENGNTLLSSVQDVDFGYGNVESSPLQILDYGPEKSQLRYFKAQDTAEAIELFKWVKKYVPQIELLDLSDKYANLNWLKPRHYEIWLSPKDSFITDNSAVKESLSLKNTSTSRCFHPQFAYSDSEESGYNFKGIKTNFQSNSTTVSSEQEVDVYFNFLNEGKGDFTKVLVGFYLSNCAQDSFELNRSNSIYTDSINSDNFKQGNAIDKIVRYRTPRTSGVYVLTGCIDYNNSIKESNEKDNCLSIELTVKNP